MTSLELIDEIEELIMMHQEGPYWDFKREWYDDSKDGYSGSVVKTKI